MKSLNDYLKNKSPYSYIVIVLIFLLSAAVVYAAEVPYKFYPGEVAKSGEVNANFKYLEDPPKKLAVPDGGSVTFLIENGGFYRLSIISCWYSAYARIGTYLIYGLNISDPKTGGKPCVLTVAETSSIDWTFSYNLNGSYDADMTVTSGGWGDQGLKIILECLSCK